MKKVLILSGSPRKNGNSDLLCNEFARGAKEAGHEVEKIRVAEKRLLPSLLRLPRYRCVCHQGRYVRAYAENDRLRRYGACKSCIFLFR